MDVPEAKRARVDNAQDMDVDTASDQAHQRPRDPDALAIASMSQRDMMVQYYQHLFPTQQLYRWLCYGHDSKQPHADARFFQRRELCFTLDGDIFVRYQSFQDGAELARALVSRCPTKIDIGPVYTHDPRQRLKYGAEFRPVSRELVFDIDLTDYDDVRTCCTGGGICNACWGFMAVAIQVLDAALREDFGFRHVLWVFSGRRGVHCWVCDEGARALLDEVRAGVVHYLSVLRGGGEGSRARVGMGASRHPSLERAHRLLTEAWVQSVLPAQGLLSTPERAAAMLQFIPDEEITGPLAARWAAGGTPSAKAPRSVEDDVAAADVSVVRWRELEEAVEAKAARLERSAAPRRRALLKGLSDCVFGNAYPRLDVDVSKKMNHLLKAPFCVHPKTGKVCVPIRPEAAWEFDPVAGVPTLQQLVTELSAARGSGAEAASTGSLWESTSLAPHIRWFETEFLAPLAKEQRAALGAKAREAGAAAAAANLSW